MKRQKVDCFTPKEKRLFFFLPFPVFFLKTYATQKIAQYGRVANDQFYLIISMGWLFYLFLFFVALYFFS